MPDLREAQICYAILRYQFVARWGQSPMFGSMLRHHRILPVNDVA